LRRHRSRINVPVIEEGERESKKVGKSVGAYDDMEVGLDESFAVT